MGVSAPPFGPPLTSHRRVFALHADRPLCSVRQSAEQLAGRVQARPEQKQTWLLLPGLAQMAAEQGTGRGVVKHLRRAKELY